MNLQKVEENFRNLLGRSFLNKTTVPCCHKRVLASSSLVISEIFAVKMFWGL